MTRDWSLLRIVIGREFRAWKKPFLLSSAIILLVAAAGLMLASRVGDDSEAPEYVIATVGETPDAFAASISAFLPDDAIVTLVSYDTEADAEMATAAGDAILAVVDDDIVIWGAGVTDALGDGVVQTLALAQVRRNAIALGVPAEDVQRLVQPDIEFRSADPDADDDGDRADEAVAVFATIIMFIAIVAYGQWIGYAVVEEKANRVVEVLLGAIRPHQLMAAKVASIGSLGLVQMAGVGALVVAVGFATDFVAVPEVAGSTVVWVVIWFLLGYGFYGALYAAAGSLASNTQEAGSTMGPLALLLAIGYMTGLISFGEGADTVWLQVMSLVPLWMPVVMPGRIVRGWAAPWEIALALAIMALTIYGMLRLAGWIYTGGVARATQKLGWREALRAGRDLRSR